jgi:GNAT superfamily N-acetyltransferase
VRAACLGDIEALVRLRLENGRVHVLLDPTVYRVPDPAQVREHFAAVLAEDDPRSAVLVAVVDDAVLGLAEIALDLEPPAHQILQPLTSAHVHLVVAAQARGLGLGAALAQAAQMWAAAQGVRQLVAGIQSDNRPALRFYGSRGYRDNAVVRIKDLPQPPPA